MAKLLWLLLLASLACKYLAGRWPWQMLALPPTAAARAAAEAEQARALLGVAPAATRADIAEAHRRLLFRVHPDRGGSDAAAYQANAARDLLLAALPPEPAPTAAPIAPKEPT